MPKELSRSLPAAPGRVFTPPALARRVAERLLARVGPEAPVLDPACGEGELLCAVLAAKGAAGVPLGEAAGRQVFGIELDPLLAERARRRLCELAGPSGGLRLAEHILQADALAPNTPWPAGTAVLANPPWVSFSGRQAPRGGTQGRPTGPGWPSLQGAFLERIAAHLARFGTRAALLLPASLIELERYGPLRAAVTSRARLLGPPEELGEAAFPGVVEPAVILELEGLDAPAAGSRTPWTERSRRTASLLAHLERFPRLPQGTFADPGVHTGNAADLLILAEGPWPGIREGRCLRPFRLAPPERRLRTDLAPSAERRFRVRPLAHYCSFTILLRQTADRPMAALHVAPTYFRNSLLAARAVSGLDPAFVVAILNGPVARAWHRAKFLDARQRAFPQVKVSHLGTQPFPIARRDDDPRLHDRLAEMVRALGGDGPATRALAAELEQACLEAFDLSPGDLYADP